MARQSIRIKVLGVALTTVVGLIGALWAAQEKAPPACVAWQHDLKTAQKMAAAQHKPMLVVFTGATGTWCRVLDRETLTDSATAAYINSKFIPVQLDGEKDRHIAEILEVTQVPTTLVLSEKADLWGTISGYVDKTRFRKALAQALLNGEKIHLASHTR